MDRRRFLGWGCAAVASAGACTPARAGSALPSMSSAPSTSPFSSKPYAGRVLIVIDLEGGNDGLNTVAPLDDPMYGLLRPRLALNARDAIALNACDLCTERYGPASIHPEDGAHVCAASTSASAPAPAASAPAASAGRRGMHPALASFMPFWRNGQLAVVEGVGSMTCGVDASNLSHFRAAQCWRAGAASDDYRSDDWLQRAMWPDNDAWRDLSSLPTFAAQVSAACHLVIANQRGSPAAERGAAPRMALRLTLNGFDTHHRQATRHAARLRELAGGVQTLHASLRAAGCWDRVCIMTTSEFGRSAAENAHGGTEHGDASMQFLIGTKVAGGFYGSAPALPADGGAMAPRVDFRQVYAAVLAQWLDVPSPAVLRRLPGDGMHRHRLPLFTQAT